MSTKQSISNANNTKIHNSWVITYPFFDTLLVISSNLKETALKFTVFDVDGQFVSNSIKLFTTNPQAVFRFNEMLLPCKLESGIKHAHVRIETSQDTDLKLMIENINQIVPFGDLITIKSGTPAALPFTISSTRTWICGLVNYETINTVARIRYYVAGGGINEVNIAIPSFGVRIISLANLPDYEKLQEGFGYLKIAVRGGDERLGAQMIEETTSRDNTNTDASFKTYAGIGGSI